MKAVALSLLIAVLSLIVIGLGSALPREALFEPADAGIAFALIGVAMGTTRVLRRDRHAEEPEWVDLDHIRSRIG